MEASTDQGAPNGTATTCQNLRRLGVWYPEAPDQSLCLNADSLYLRDLFCRGYQPLFWLHFGGPRGSYLQNLTKITVLLWNGGCEGVAAIGFGYDTLDIPHTGEILGRPGRRIGSGPDIIDPVVFEIDGRGGERIAGLELCLQRAYSRFSENDKEDWELQTMKVSSVLSPSWPTFEARACTPPANRLSGRNKSW